MSDNPKSYKEAFERSELKAFKAHMSQMTDVERRCVMCELEAHRDALMDSFLDVTEEHLKAIRSAQARLSVLEELRIGGLKE